jgi:signal transduction histidine kinase
MLNEIPPEAVSEVDEVLHTLGQESGMPTVLLTHVQDGWWSPRAIRDEGRFGLAVGTRLDAQRTICREVVNQSNGGLAVDDARRDERFRDHPAHLENGIAAYVGVPFRLADGTVVGTLCAIDRTPHVGLDAALRLYRLFARLLAHEFELAEVARISRAALTTETEHGMSRERFLAAVAHDLRTPLAAIEASAQLMARRDHSKNVMQGVARIRYSAERMGRLVDDLLDLARGRLGAGIPVQREELSDVRAFLRSIFTELASAHGGGFQADVQVDNRSVHWDRDRITQCLDNIITNALVHGATDAPVSVVARATPTHVIIDVVNGGEIPESDRTTLFDPFHGPRTVRHGLGLGLFIADQIVRAHGGSIAVESLNGETSTRITLPA